MWWLDLLIACGGAVVGAVTAEVLARARGARSRARIELVKIRAELTQATTAQAVAAAQLAGLRDRIDDVLHRLDAKRGPGGV